MRLAFWRKPKEPTATAARRAHAARLQRSFAAAGLDHPFAGWQGALGTLEWDLRSGLVRMRSRSRALARDNDYMKHFLQLVAANVVGAHGIRLQVKSQDPNGAPDIQANRLIERAWADWVRHGVCTADGRLSWVEVQSLVMRLIARDGEVLVREMPGFRNGHGYALQVIPADALDETYFGRSTNGNEVRFGVEVDRYDRPMAYHLRIREGERYIGRHERVPAAQMLHLYMADDALQSRGLPWVHASTRRLGMLGGFEEAAVTAARVGAAKMGFFTNADGGSYTPPDGVDDEGFPQTVAEAGSFDVLPAGFDFKAFDPDYPNGETGPFIKTMLRGVAAGLGVSYTSLSGDLEGVNMSSIRAGLLEERAVWMGLQQWLIERLHTRVFTGWLEGALISQRVPLPLSKIDKFNAPRWYPRRWQWTEPTKDLLASSGQVALGISSRTALAAEQGRDFAEVLDELREEKRLAEAAGVSLGLPTGWAIDRDTEETGDAGRDPNGNA